MLQLFLLDPNHITVSCHAAKLFVVVVRHDGLPSVVCNAGFNEPARSGSSSVHLPLQWWWKPVKHYDGHLKWYDKDWQSLFSLVSLCPCHQLPTFRLQESATTKAWLRPGSAFEVKISFCPDARPTCHTLLESESLSLLMRHEKKHWSPNICTVAALRWV